MVSTLSPHITHLIRQIGSFEEPVSKQWAMPISMPISTLYSPNFNTFHYVSHQIISKAMTRISCSFADALVASSGGLISDDDAASFKEELVEREGICSIYHTVWARKQ
jgi:hypothetical protein